MCSVMVCCRYCMALWTTRKVVNLTGGPHLGGKSFSGTIWNMSPAIHHCSNVKHDLFFQWVEIFPPFEYIQLELHTIDSIIVKSDMRNNFLVFFFPKLFIGFRISENYWSGVIIWCNKDIEDIFLIAFFSLSYFFHGMSGKTYSRGK